MNVRLSGPHAHDHALHVHTVALLCDMIYGQKHSTPPAIINSDVQPNVVMYA